ncbi:hypothetical protein [Rhodococcus sp. p52]|uniref:hypothetical protein n=1 Tax=Rhodococcus sp. p52 TaxID=935199 RepID=UPI001E43174F|nr:hypothetical protein [Rhodococcus sp. p52]
METAQERGFDRGIEVNGQRVTTLTERLDRLRGRWRELRAQENQLRTELHTWGIDPEAVPKQTVREVAAAQPAWREHPATERQLRTIERLAAEANVPFVLDDDITKGQAHDLITAMLAGNLPNAQFTDRPAGPMFIPAATPAEPATPPAPAAAETSQDEEPQVEQPRPRPRIDPLADVERRVLERLAEPDTDADTAANPQVNTAAQFLSWADGHFTVKAQVALADLMADRDSLTDEQFLVCRVMLSDPKRWGELGHRAAEAYWQARTGEPTQHPVTTEVADAIVEARADVERPFTEDFLDTTQAVLDTQEPAEPATAEQRGEHVAAVQDGIDQAATVEVDQWWARGRAAYDPADPLTLPQPDTDPQVAAAIGKVRSRTGRDEIRSQWFAGVEQARREATAGERQALIAEVAVDPRLIAQVEGRRPDYLPAVTRSEVKSLIAEAARKAPPLRQAAAKVLLEHRLPDELYERAYAEWERVHGPELTWDQGTAAQWTAWMTMHARRDPLLGSWVGLPMYSRTPIIEIGIETAFEVMAEERPDLIAATADIPTERLAAEMRGNIIPNLPAPDPSELSAQFQDGAAYCALTLKDRPNSKVTYFPIRGWDYTLGGDSSVTCGRNARAAIGALLEARNIALPEWIERAYRPYAQARATVLTRAIAYARNNEFYHAAASADLLWRYSQSGSAVADHALIKDVRRGIIDQLRSDFPAETALLDRYGIDLAWTLQHDVDPTVLREIRTSGDDLYSPTPTDLTFAGAGDVVLGDPDGQHITLRFSWAHNSTERITYVDDQPRPELTLRDAIAEARAMLATEHASGQLDADTATAAQTQADTAAEAEPQVSEEAEPPSPRAVAPAIDDAGAVIFEEVDPAPSEPSAPTGTAPATETPATSWVFTDRLMTGHIGPTTAPDPEPEPATTIDVTPAPDPEATIEPEATAPTGDTEDLVVPETAYGEPLSSPLWRDKRQLVRVRKESGAHIWVSRAAAARYAAAAGIAPPPAADQSQRESAAAAAAITPEIDPKATAETVPPETGAASTRTDTEAEADQGAAVPEHADAAVARPAAPAVAVQDFALGTEVLVPSGAKARARANIAALRLVRRLDQQQRPATADEQAVLAQWSGWGAIPEVFDNRARILAQWGDEHAELLDLLGDKGFAQARQTTLNAHYTDPAVVAELWRAVARAGLPDGAVVLEPGCGAGHFVGTAPESVRMVGVEIEPISAKIAHYLYPSQQIRNHGFERNFAPRTPSPGRSATYRSAGSRPSTRSTTQTVCPSTTTSSPNRWR